MFHHRIRRLVQTNSARFDTIGVCYSPWWYNGVFAALGVEKFGCQYAKSIRRDRLPAGDKWHLDEVVIGIRGVKHWLWRAVNQNGNALEILVQRRRNTQAAKRFTHKLMKRNGQPRMIDRQLDDTLL